MAHITLISTGQPTTNPRLVKEAEHLLARGHVVKVICCFYQSWATAFDEEITGRNSDTYSYCGGSPLNGKFIYTLTRVRQKVCGILAKYYKGASLPENAISRTHKEALRRAKQFKSELYIAHNLGALPAAVLAAQFHNAKVGYDAEDLNSGQYDTKNGDDYLLNRFIERKYFTQTDYVTAASPLIAACYQTEYPYLSPVVINNVFPKTNLPVKKNYDGTQPLKLLWFSQTIGPDRGLEAVIMAMAKINNCVELHLVGNCADSYKHTLTALAHSCQLKQHQLYIHAPLSPGQLLLFTADFDIGIAAETTATLNRDICLTNKIFTYIQCGLALLASDTQAQTIFMKSYPQTGQLYGNKDIDTLAQGISLYANHPDMLYQTRCYNYDLGQTRLNWELESEIFTSIIDRTLI